MKIQHHRPHSTARQAAYPDIGDQLDAVLEMAAALKAQGVALPKKTLDWIAQCESVKVRHPKGGRRADPGQ